MALNLKNSASGRSYLLLLEIINDLPIGFPINNIISLSPADVDGFVSGKIWAIARVRDTSDVRKVEK